MIKHSTVFHLSNCNKTERNYKLMFSKKATDFIRGINRQIRSRCVLRSVINLIALSFSCALSGRYTTSVAAVKVFPAADGR